MIKKVLLNRSSIVIASVALILQACSSGGMHEGEDGMTDATDSAAVTEASTDAVPEGGTVATTEDPHAAAQAAQPEAPPASATAEAASAAPAPAAAQPEAAAPVLAANTQTPPAEPAPAVSAAPAEPEKKAEPAKKKSSGKKKESKPKKEAEPKEQAQLAPSTTDRMPATAAQAPKPQAPVAVQQPVTPPPAPVQQVAQVQQPVTPPPAPVQQVAQVQQPRPVTPPAQKPVSHAPASITEEPEEAPIWMSKWTVGGLLLALGGGGVLFQLRARRKAS